MPNHEDINSPEDLSARIEQVLGEDMLEAVEAVRVQTEKYLRQKAELEYLDRIRKVLLADINDELRAQYGQREEKVTETRLESESRSHGRYKRYLEARREAARELAEREAQYYRSRNKLDVLQGQLAYAKSEMYHLQNS